MTALTKPVRRVSGSPAGRYGKDAQRNLVASLIPGDMVELRPAKTQRRMTITFTDLWSFLLKCEANKTRLEKEAIRKAKKEEAKKRAAWKREIKKPLAQ